MKALRPTGLIAITLLLTLLLAACGSSGTQGTSMNDSNQGMNNSSSHNMNGGMTTATPMTGGTMATNNNGMMGGITIVPSMGGDMNAFIHTGIATIDGKQVNVLMTNKGFAVYYYKSDNMFTAACTGACAHAWPPVLAPQGMMTISSSLPLPKQLSIHQTPNGAQVFYDGHALYTYAADTEPGVATGRAVGLQWYLVGFLL